MNRSRECRSWISISWAEMIPPSRERRTPETHSTIFPSSARRLRRARRSPPGPRPSCSMKSLPPRRSAACRKRALPRRRPLPSEGRMMHPFGRSLRRRLRPRRLRSCSISTMRLWSVPHPGRRRLQFLPERPRSISEFWKKSPPGPRRLLLPRHWMATRRCRWIFWTMQSLSPLCRPRLRRR